jgi:hypothetical protein
MGLSRHPTAAELTASFERFLNRALVYGEGGITSCSGLTTPVFDAIDVVARQHPNASDWAVREARAVFADFLAD